MIEIKKLGCTIDGSVVLDGIQLNIERGSFTAVLGRNGSGKSTLARHFNALRVPSCGEVLVDGMNTDDETLVYDIRERVGMVFQNPDSQAVASIVEDDTAFAPENLGLDEEEIERHVDFALDAVGISNLRNRPMSSLSGGQKQLAAIAGIVAMRSRYMVFDESSSMLDPAARKKVLECVLKLKRELGTAVIWITHNMEEAAVADRVIILDGGKITADGTPQEIFSDFELVERSGLDMTPSAKLCMRLMREGYPIEKIALTPGECAENIKKMIVAARGRRNGEQCLN